MWCCAYKVWIYICGRCYARRHVTNKGETCIYIGGSPNHPRHNWCCSGIDYSITNEQISSNDRRNQVEKVLFYNDGFPPLDSSTVKDNDNVELINDYYSKYIVKYMSGVTLNKVTSFGVKVLLSDGSGFTSYLQAQAINGAPTLWVMYCLNADEKYCKNNVYDGKNQFLFYIDTEKAHMETFGSDKGSCYNTNKELRYSCAGLIKQNGWKIPDDYPWIK